LVLLVICHPCFHRGWVGCATDSPKHSDRPWNHTGRNSATAALRKHEHITIRRVDAVHRKEGCLSGAATPERFSTNSTAQSIFHVFQIVIGHT
jgi:hypothetical protein